VNNKQHKKYQDGKAESQRKEIRESGVELPSAAGAELIRKVSCCCTHYVLLDHLEFAPRLDIKLLMSLQDHILTA
jgi:hypothetical protein